MFPNAFWHETNLQAMRANAGTAELVRFSPDGIQHYRTGPTSRVPAPATNLSSKHLNSYSLAIRRVGTQDPVLGYWAKRRHTPSPAHQRRMRQQTGSFLFSLRGKQAAPCLP